MVAPAISRRFEGSTFVEEKKVLQLDWAVLVCSRFRFRWSTEGTSVVGILGVTEVVETKQKGGGRVAGFSCAGGGIKGDRSFDETDRSVRADRENPVPPPQGVSSSASAEGAKGPPQPPFKKAKTNADSSEGEREKEREEHPKKSSPEKEDENRAEVGSLDGGKRTKETLRPPKNLTQTQQQQQERQAKPGPHLPKSSHRWKSDRAPAFQQKRSGVPPVGPLPVTIPLWKGGRLPHDLVKAVIKSGKEQKEQMNQLSSVSPRERTAAVEERRRVWKARTAEVDCLKGLGLDEIAGVEALLKMQEESGRLIAREVEREAEEEAARVAEKEEILHILMEKYGLLLDGCRHLSLASLRFLLARQRERGVSAFPPPPVASSSVGFYNASAASADSAASSLSFMQGDARKHSIHSRGDEETATKFPSAVDRWTAALDMEPLQHTDCPIALGGGRRPSEANVESPSVMGGAVGGYSGFSGPSKFQQGGQTEGVGRADGKRASALESALAQRKERLLALKAGFLASPPASPQTQYLMEKSIEFKAAQKGSPAGYFLVTFRFLPRARPPRRADGSLSPIPVSVSRGGGMANGGRQGSPRGVGGSWDAVIDHARTRRFPVGPETPLTEAEALVLAEGALPEGFDGTVPRELIQKYLDCKESWSPVRGLDNPVSFPAAPRGLMSPSLSPPPRPRSPVRLEEGRGGGGRDGGGERERETAQPEDRKKSPSGEAAQEGLGAESGGPAVAAFGNGGAVGGGRGGVEGLGREADIGISGTAGKQEGESKGKVPEETGVSSLPREEASSSASSSSSASAVPLPQQ
uniref:Uncharacterized protein n=1 Tax=Chromera velia CCMP2878 TaxID=1169474 RepID=A0A0G4IC80_9ALVE|eukprot:Cvel_12958.t1-p1 / transcript=Cvel_12958.t1 / gene=Cvel_12958 / organism=Chromera_velia_CCMP2878 / gene_product=hypothetical protein / transcript_product=hypothetical protein / location=Cvel_scaffold867:29262-41767(-) / protein_length=809 / sequence_SO=supercontig / SO=protein_coding / is_pseudo=false